ncbi:MAG: C-GCAxxG-C-C family protein [bacterium]|nr:C-GCAxxG-C-C family protein [bacterium]
MKAQELFKQGYNCAQSVFCEYCEKVGIDYETGLKLASSFGGGMGRLREVCGAVSAMFMLIGLKQGYISPTDDNVKEKHYAKVQELAQKFEEKFGSIICRDLLGLPSGKCEAKPSKRTEEYYKERPCEEFIKFASELIEKEL